MSSPGPRKSWDQRLDEFWDLMALAYIESCEMREAQADSGKP